MKCLDTDLLVATLRGKREAWQKISEIEETGRAATTSVNSYELFFGAYRSARKKDNVDEVAKLMEKLVIFPLDVAASQRAAEISSSLVAKGEMIDIRDALVASIAMVNDLTLVTRNQIHFRRIRDLKLELW
jgi:tRNA(fMet)-specific endonuclease VapC